MSYLATITAVAAAILVGPGVQAPAEAASTVSLWGSAKPASSAVAAEKKSVELGTRFTPTVNGTVTALRYYKTKANKGKHVGTLWSPTGAKLASGTFTKESSSGWQTLTLKKPVALVAGATYTVSYHAKYGRYLYTASTEKMSGTTALTVGSGVFRYGSSIAHPTSTWRGLRYGVDVKFRPGTPVAPVAPTATATPTTAAPSATASAPATTTPTATATATASATATATATAPATPTASGSVTVASRSGFPTASTTGVPAGTTLSTYSGPCTITTANTVIDAKVVNCALEIKAKGVTITRSRVNGTVYSDTTTASSFSISDSEVNVGNVMGTGLGDANFTATRVHITGGNRSVNCYLNCTITDSYVHGQFTDKSGVAHESGIRMGANAVIRHNTIVCDAPDVPPDAGCSAALTGYGDFDPVQNNTIDNNYFPGTTGGFCAYGGSSTGKPFSSSTKNIRFTNNVFGRGSSGRCGYYGPITSFDTSLPGNTWSGNVWENGTSVPAAN